ncbi:MAG: DUF507 family protein [Nitrospirota bacterium]
MRVPKSWVPILSKKIIVSIVSKELIRPKVPMEKLLFETEEIILDELTVEDRLNEEIRALLKKHESEIESNRIDYRKLFELTKQKLVKERGLIL